MKNSWHTPQMHKIAATHSELTQKDSETIYKNFTHESNDYRVTSDKW
jgi:superfamily II DNA/RNA helicase